MLPDRPTPPCHGLLDIFLVDTPLDPNGAYNPVQAKLLCAGCPAEFKQPCDEGATVPETDYYMIRAGLTPQERLSLTPLPPPPPPRDATEGVHGPRRQPINHGTRSGYNVHRKRGEEPCLPCRTANATEQRYATYR